MLSQELASHADRVLGWAARGLGASTDQLAMLAHCLLDLSQQAKQLEHLPVDDAAWQGDQE